MARKFELSVIVQALDKMSGPFRKMTATLKRFKQKTEGARKAFGKMQTKMSAVATKSKESFKKIGGAFRKITLPIAGLGALAIRSSLKFNEAMANIGTLIPGNQKRLEGLKTSVQKAGIQFGLSTGNMSKGLFQLISVMGDSNETIAKMKIASKAAVAGGSSVTQAVNLMSAVTLAYGDKSASAMKKVGDLAFLTNKLGKTTFPELAGSMGNVAGIAASLKVSQSELFAVFATLTKTLGSTEETTTSVAGAMASFMKPSATMTKAIKALGFANSGAMIQSLGLVGSIKKLAGSTNGTTEELSKLFPNIRAIKGILNLTGGQAKEFEQNLLAMKKSAGATGQAFLEQTKGINKMGFSFKQMKVRVQVMAQQFGDALLPVLKILIDVVGGIVKVFSGMSKGMKGTIVIVAAVVAAIVPLVAVIKAVITMIQIMKIVMAAVSFSPMMIGITLAIGAVVALIAIFGKARTSFKDLKRSTQDVARANRSGAIELKKYGKSLDLAKQLGKAKKGTSEYKKITEGLVALQPKLAAANKKAGGSFEDLAAKIKKASAAQMILLKAQAVKRFQEMRDKIGNIDFSAIGEKFKETIDPNKTKEQRIRAQIEYDGMVQGYKNSLKVMAETGKLAGLNISADFKKFGQTMKDNVAFGTAGGGFHDAAVGATKLQSVLKGFKTDSKLPTVAKLDTTKALKGKDSKTQIEIKVKTEGGAEAKLRKLGQKGPALLNLSKSRLLVTR